MKNHWIALVIVTIAGFSTLSSCQTATKEQPQPTTSTTQVEQQAQQPAAQQSSQGGSKDEIQPVVTEVLTKEERDALSPNDVLKIFKEGNERFINNDLTARDHSKLVRQSAKGQFPKAVVLSCVDSRIPVEDVFDRGIGDVFVARVAGNFVNEDILGSMEFATAVAGSKLVIVMGHEHCGAIKAAVDNVQLGNITPMLKNIRPVVEATEYDGTRTSGNQEFVHKVCVNNVFHTIDQIRARSPILKELEDTGQIQIVAAVYDMDTGVVEFMDEQ